MALSDTEKPRHILIGLCNISERSSAAIQTLLRSNAQFHSRITAEHEAEIVIVDIDGGNPADLWSKFRQKFPTHPAIVLSITEQHISDVLWVRKPVSPALLLEAIQLADRQIQPAPPPVQSPPVAQIPQETNTSNQPQIAQQPNIALADTEDQTPASATTATTKITRHYRDDQKSAVHTREVTLAMGEAAGQSIFGDHSDIDAQNSNIPAHVFYEPHTMLQGLISETLEAARADGKSRVIEGVLAAFIVIPDAPGWILTELSVQRIRAISAVNLSNMLQTNVRYLIERKRPILLPKFLLENVLWLVSLSASRGRVPIGTNLHAPVKLDRWPNFTRLETIPHAMRISALWLAHPMSLLETATRLKIPQRYVFSFYSAAHAIGIASLVTVPASPSELRISNQSHGKLHELEHLEHADHKESRSFLGKLLKRLMRE